MSEVREESGHVPNVLRVLADSEEAETARAAARELGLHMPPADARIHRRPGVTIAGSQISLVLMVIGPERHQHALRLYASDTGLLALGDEEALAVARPVMSEDGPDAWTQFADVVLAVARHCGQVLDQLDDDSQALQDRATGYSSSPQRRTMGRLRTDLFRIGETQAAHQNLLSPDEELAQTLGDAHRRILARAAVAFSANQSTTSRLYAMLGDVLDEHDMLVSERLTLVATIFLPLTVTTGFFGMNFAWLTDHIQGLPAFLLLGILAPALLTLGTFVLVRRMTRST